jgi:peptidoglycan/xylan/chitin deacetylase (PgdA/CDA1 family)
MGRSAHGVVRSAAGVAAFIVSVAASAALAGPLQVAEMQGADTCVALTFDDGPDVDLTPKLLSILESKGVTATFFVVGYRAALWPDIVRRAAADGFEIGNHSWNHPALTALATESAARQISRTDEQVNQIIGRRPSVIRAPYGSLSWRIASIDSRTFVGWDVDTQDWLHFSQWRITDRAVNRARNGSIILMHDIHRTTIAAVGDVIDGLRARGFRFVTVSALLGGVCGGTPVSEEVANEGPLIHRTPPPATDEIAMAPSATHHTRAQRAAPAPAPSSALLGFLPGGAVPNMAERPKAFFIGQ